MIQLLAKTELDRSTRHTGLHVAHLRARRGGKDTLFTPSANDVVDA